MWFPAFWMIAEAMCIVYLAKGKINKFRKGGIFQNQCHKQITDLWVEHRLWHSHWYVTIKKGFRSYSVRNLPPFWHTGKKSSWIKWSEWTGWGTDNELSHHNTSAFLFWHDCSWPSAIEKAWSWMVWLNGGFIHKALRQTNTTKQTPQNSSNQVPILTNLWTVFSPTINIMS